MQKSFFSKLSKIIEVVVLNAAELRPSSFLSRIVRYLNFRRGLLSAASFCEKSDVFIFIV